MYIGFKENAITLSMIEKLRWRIRRNVCIITDHKFRGVNPFYFSDYVYRTSKESHILYLIKRKL